MLRFLLDANISHETAEFLESLGYEAKTVAQFGLEKAEDPKIVEKAIKEKMILVTFDLDFGEIFYFSAKEKIWIIVLRIRDQTVESVNKTLNWLLQSKILEKKESQNTLMIIEEGRIRIRKKF
jgi:predicted nuclease of predicted toxin-antitoxin system